jgi:uncharacterized membrane protein YqgA involved in biofilm formation
MMSTLPSPALTVGIGLGLSAAGVLFLYMESRKASAAPKEESVGMGQIRAKWIGQFFAVAGLMMMVTGLWRLV